MYRRANGILLAILLLLSGCSTPTGTPPVTVQMPISTPQPPTLTPRTLSATPDAVLTRVQGQVSVQQVITGQVVLALFGDYLWRGDIIVTGQDAQVEAMCSDGDAILVEPNQSVTVTCGKTPNPVYQRVILRVHSGQIEALPSTRLGPPDYGNLPVVLSPRNTKITDRRPAIRWLAVEGAEDYEVVMRESKSALWRTTTQELELPYPATQPALEAGVMCLVQVIARMGSAKQPRTSKTVWVTVLSAAEVAQVRQFEAQVEALGLSAESARFVLAAYYADQELYNAAIAQLVPLAKGTPSPLTYRLLGDVYLAVELDGEAEKNYAEAYKLAQEQGNRLVQAEAEVGLGHVAFAIGKFEAALSHYQAALTLYRELGPESDAEAVAKFVADTKARLPAPTP